MEFKLQAQQRDIIKKKVKNLRSQGLIPAAVFGYKGNFNVQLNQKIFEKMFPQAGHTSIVQVELNEKIHNVLIDEVQIDPVSRNTRHVSLREVRMDEEITVQVPLELVGEEASPAVADEDQLIILTVNEIEVRGLPGNLPTEIKIDVSGFHAGDTITLDQIKLPEGVHLVEHLQGDEETEEREYPTMVTTVGATQTEEELKIEPSGAELEAQEDEGAATEGETEVAKEE